MRNIFGLTLAAAGLLGGCGGDVRVDGEPGSAGQGGGGGASSSSSSTASTTPTTSSGPVPSTSNTGPSPACDCFGACQKLTNECGLGDIPCDEFCQGVPQDVWQCVCNQSDCNVEFCFSGPSGSGTSGSGGAGGSPNQGCEECVNDQANGACAPQLQTCLNDMQCVELFECHAECGWTPDCNQKCDATFPGGFPEFIQFIGCSVCGGCFDACSQTPLIQYCLEEG